MPQWKAGSRKQHATYGQTDGHPARQTLTQQGLTQYCNISCRGSTTRPNQQEAERSAIVVVSVNRQIKSNLPDFNTMYKAISTINMLLPRKLESIRACLAGGRSIIAFWWIVVGNEYVSRGEQCGLSSVPIYFGSMAKQAGNCLVNIAKEVSQCSSLKY